MQKQCISTKALLSREASSCQLLERGLCDEQQLQGNALHMERWGLCTHHERIKNWVFSSEQSVITGDIFKLTTEGFWRSQTIWSQRHSKCALRFSSSCMTASRMILNQQLESERVYLLLLSRNWRLLPIQAKNMTTKTTTMTCDMWQQVDDMLSFLKTTKYKRAKKDRQQQQQHTTCCLVVVL